MLVSQWVSGGDKSEFVNQLGGLESKILSLG